MSRIAIVKVRSAHDVEWRLPKVAATTLNALGMTKLKEHLRSTEGQTFMPQLTLPYLSALGQRYNEQQGKEHQFVLIDEQEKDIKLRGYDMIWFTAVSPTAKQIYRLSKRARAQGAVTVIGGIHATMLPEDAAPHADVLALGEGESTVPELLGDWDAPDRELKPRYQGRPVGGLEQLPLPRWGDAQVADYCPWIIPVQTSRGCRNACHFCSTTRYQGSKRRHRPLIEIVDEIKWLKDEGILTKDKVVFFTDNNIVSDSDHRKGVTDTRYAESLFKALAPLGIDWLGQGEINVADNLELTDLMAESGCYMLLVGLETISQENLRALGKPSNQVETYTRHINTLHRYGISLIGCFIFGLDNDTPDVFDESFGFIDRYIDIPQVALLTPFPGTALYRKMKRQERLLHEDWSRYDASHGVFEPKKMTAEQLMTGYAHFTDRLYSYPLIFRRALRHAVRPRMRRAHALSVSGRFSSVLAPNLVYRHLSRIGREEVPNIAVGKASWSQRLVSGWPRKMAQLRG